MILVFEKEDTPLEAYNFYFSYNHDTISYDVVGEVNGEEKKKKTSILMKFLFNKQSASRLTIKAKQK